MKLKTLSVRVLPNFPTPPQFFFQAPTCLRFDWPPCSPCCWWKSAGNIFFCCCWWPAWNDGSLFTDQSETDSSTENPIDFHHQCRKNLYFNQKITRSIFSPIRLMVSYMVQVITMRMRAKIFAPCISHWICFRFVVRKWVLWFGILAARFW